MYNNTTSRHLIFTLLCLSLCCFTAIGQEQPATDVTNVTKLDFLNPGISHEQRIGKNQTLHFSAIANILISTVISSNYDHTDVYVDPAAEAGYRYYFNFARRERKEKRTEKNSANYVSLYSQFIYSKMPVGPSYFKESARRPLGVIGTCWGMQRNYAGHFSLDLNLGLQYRIGRSTYEDLMGNRLQKTAGEFLPAGNLTLGIWLN